LAAKLRHGYEENPSASKKNIDPARGDVLGDKERLIVLGVGNGQKLKLLTNHLKENQEIILIDLCNEFLEI